MVGKCVRAGYRGRTNKGIVRQDQDTPNWSMHSSGTKDGITMIVVLGARSLFPNVWELPANTGVIAPAILDMSILHKSPGFMAKPWVDQLYEMTQYLLSLSPKKRALSVQWLFGWFQDPAPGAGMPWGETTLAEMLDRPMQDYPQWKTDYQALGQAATALRQVGIDRLQVSYANVETGISLQGAGLIEARRRISTPALRGALPAAAGSITPEALGGQFGWDRSGYMEACLLWSRVFNYQKLDNAIFSALRPLAKLGPVVNSPGGYAGGEPAFVNHDYNGWPIGERQGIAAPQLYLDAGQDYAKPFNRNGCYRLGVSDQDPRWLNFILSVNVLRARMGSMPVFGTPEYCKVTPWHLECLMAAAAESGVNTCFLFNAGSNNGLAPAGQITQFEQCARQLTLLGAQPSATQTFIPYDSTEVVLKSRAITKSEYLARLPAPFVEAVTPVATNPVEDARH